MLVFCTIMMVTTTGNLYNSNPDCQNVLLTLLKICQRKFSSAKWVALVILTVGVAVVQVTDY